MDSRGKTAIITGVSSPKQFFERNMVFGGHLVLFSLCVVCCLNENNVFIITKIGLNTFIGVEQLLRLVFQLLFRVI